MIVIINSGLGNIASVWNMILKVGGQAIISDQKEDILKASKLILPGVGAFDHGINQLKSLDLLSVIHDQALAGIPLLGICLGMQLLSRGSEEGNLPGLGLINAEFHRFSFPQPCQLRVPHVGWNIIKVKKTTPLLADSEEEQRFYFTHSYHAVCSRETDILTYTEYGYAFPSSYADGNIYGVQFHPEKSHRFGMGLMKNFVEM
jgi:glutamine amidotransferase